MAHAKREASVGCHQARRVEEWGAGMCHRGVEGLCAAGDRDKLVLARQGGFVPRHYRPTGLHAAEDRRGFCPRRMLESCSSLCCKELVDGSG